MGKKTDESTNDFQPSPTMLYWNKIIDFVTAVILVVVGLISTFLIPYVSEKGIGFPKKSQVQYSEGILKVDRVHIRREVVSYIVINNSTYVCSYTIENLPISGQCLPYSQLEPYIGQYAKVGWYTQKKFLGYDNSHRQLVFLQINGKTLKSYEQVKSYIEQTKNEISLNFVSIIFGLFLTGAGSLVIYRLANGTHKN